MKDIEPLLCPYPNKKANIQHLYIGSCQPSILKSYRYFFNFLNVPMDVPVSW